MKAFRDSKLFNITSHYERIKSFYIRYERVLMPATLVVGFLVDYFTFANIQVEITFTLLLIYWVAAGITIALSHLYDAQKLSQKFKYFRLFSPLLVQFTFGALLSASLIFYWFSGALSVSWPIILVIALLMVSNDMFRKHFIKPIVQLSVYFFATFSLFSVIVPFLFNSLSVWWFVLAGILSLFIFLPYLFFLSNLQDSMRQQRRPLFISIIVIFGVMNLLYFYDIIPPIPLALREAGLYHALRTSNGSYIMQAEPETFWQQLVPGQLLQVMPHEKIYCYTAIFAPADLHATIVHDWQRYDEQTKQWVSVSRLSFGISGGRQKGYKGYSFVSNLEPGKWRIFVENQRGQVLGRIKFMVENVEEQVELYETKR